jgi:hypothetical protein
MEDSAHAPGGWSRVLRTSRRTLLRLSAGVTFPALSMLRQILMAYNLSGGVEKGLSRRGRWSIFVLIASIFTHGCLLRLAFFPSPDSR